MSTHTFERDDVVMVYQVSSQKGLLIEGQATIVERVGDADELYAVRFRSDVTKHGDLEYCPVYNRFVDPEGQRNPLDHIDAYNRKHGHTGQRKEPAMRDYNT